MIMVTRFVGNKGNSLWRH